MGQESLLKLWDESWEQGIWIAPWGKAVMSLTPMQAAWKPASDRHCIWQIVNHVSFWREYTLTTLAGRPNPTKEDVERDNFAMPSSASELEWQRSLHRLRETHQRIRDAIADDQIPLDRLRYHLGHDCYHLGQIMLLRSLQGMPPIE